MRIDLPKSDRHPLLRLTIETPQDSWQTLLDDSHRTADILLPDGVSEDEAHVVGEFCDGGGRASGPAFPIKPRAEKPAHASQTRLPKSRHQGPVGQTQAEESEAAEEVTRPDKS